MRPRAMGLVSLVFLVAGSSTVHAQVMSNFNSSSEGWQVVSFGNLSTGDYSVVGTYTPTYNTTGGNPGGYISSTDPDSGDFTFSAPSKFLGNQTGITTLNYNILYTFTPNYSTTDVMLIGNGTRLLWEASPPLVPSSLWSTVTVSLAPSSNWTVGSPTGSAATATDFANVLSNLTGFYIRGEYAGGPDNTGIDNVQFSNTPTATPEPGAYAFLGSLGLVAMSRLRRKHVRK